MAKTSKAKKAGKIIKKIILSLTVVIFTIIAVAGVYGFYLYTLATDTSEAYKLDTKASTDIYAPLARSVVTHYRQEITPDQINGIIKTIMEEYFNPEDNAENDVVIKNVAIYTRKNNRGTVYADISFRDIRMIYSADISFYVYEYEPSILIDFSNSKIGKLEISDRVIMKAFSETFQNKYGIKCRHCSLQIPNSYTFEFMNQEVTLEIEKLMTNDEGNVMVQTTGIIDVIDQIIDGTIDDIFSKKEE